MEFVYLADLVGCGAFPYLSKMIRLRALRKFIIGNAPDVVVSFQVHVNIASILSSLGNSIPLIVCERSYPGTADVPWVMRVLRRFFYSRAQPLFVRQKLPKPGWLNAFRKVRFSLYRIRFLFLCLWGIPPSSNQRILFQQIGLFC